MSTQASWPTSRSIGRTVRPPSEILNLSLDGGDDSHHAAAIRSGSPASAGAWRRSLRTARCLHGVTGSPRVTAVEKSDKEEAYNLVVADFNTYFVGDSGVLVHDNTPRTPTRTTLPGLAAR